MRKKIVLFACALISANGVATDRAKVDCFDSPILIDKPLSTLAEELSKLKSNTKFLASIEEIYKNFPKEKFIGEHSQIIRFSASSSTPKLFIIHPHKKFDVEKDSSHRKKMLEELLNDPKVESYVILEGFYGFSYDEVLSEKNKEYNPGEVSLSTFGKGKASVGTGGAIKIDPDSWSKENTVLLAGGYFTDCQKNAAAEISKSFAKSERGKNLTIKVLSNLSTDHTPRLDKGKITQKKTLLSDDIKNSSESDRTDLAKWYVSGLLSHTLGRHKSWNGRVVVSINGKVLYEKEPSDDAGKNRDRTIEIKIEPHP